VVEKGNIIKQPLGKDKTILLLILWGRGGGGADELKNLVEIRAFKGGRLINLKTLNGGQRKK